MATGGRKLVAVDPQLLRAAARAGRAGRGRAHRAGRARAALPRRARRPRRAGRWTPARSSTRLAEAAGVSTRDGLLAYDRELVPGGAPDRARHCRSRRAARDGVLPASELAWLARHPGGPPRRAATGGVGDAAGGDAGRRGRARRCSTARPGWWRCWPATPTGRASVRAGRERRLLAGARAVARRLPAGHARAATRGARRRAGGAGDVARRPRRRPGAPRARSGWRGSRATWPSSTCRAAGRGLGRGARGSQRPAVPPLSGPTGPRRHAQRMPSVWSSPGGPPAPAEQASSGRASGSTAASAAARSRAARRGGRWRRTGSRRRPRR